MHAYRMAWRWKMRTQKWPQITLQSVILAMLSTRVLPRCPVTTDPPQITISECFIILCGCIDSIFYFSVSLQLFLIVSVALFKCQICLPCNRYQFYGKLPISQHYILILVNGNDGDKIIQHIFIEPVVHRGVARNLVFGYFLNVFCRHLF